MESQEAVLRILHIGDGPPGPTDTVISWGEMASLPAVIQYSVITIRPGEGTEAEQRELLEALASELKAQTRIDTRIVWILNSSSIDVAEALGFGEMVPLRHLSGGSVRTELRGIEIELEDIAYAIVPDAAKQVDGLAWWVRSDGDSEVSIAALSGDTRWILLPPFSGDIYQAVAARTSRVTTGRSLRATAIFAVCAWLLLAAFVLLRGAADYRAGVADLGDEPISEYAFPVPDIVAELDSVWLTHSERMVTRLLFEHGYDIGVLAPELGTNANAYELWRSGRVRAAEQTYDGPLLYYWLALLGGDLPSAYRIIREADHEIDRLYTWDRAVTNTLWQAAIESLQELDFDRSRLYTQMYLASTHEIAQGLTSYGMIADLPHRNITLARILNREFQEARIFSLCDRPEAGAAFGSLVGGWGWGYRLPPGNVSGLGAVRTANQQEYCRQPRGPGVDYSVLTALADRRSETPYTGYVSETAAPCSLTPVECRYLGIRARLRSNPDTATVAAALSYAGDCSYLSDDAIALALAEVAVDPEAFPLDGSAVSRRDVPMSMSRLRAAMNGCTSPSASDYYRVIERMLDQLRCEQLIWDTPPAALAASSHSGLVSLAERCGP